jgi:hypothetical protein
MRARDATSHTTGVVPLGGFSSRSQRFPTNRIAFTLRSNDSHKPFGVDALPLLSNGQPRRGGRTLGGR